MKAYPFQHKNPTSGLVSESEGMDLRDWFAGQAMQAVIVNSDRESTAVDEVHSWIGSYAYTVADAMLKAREVKHDNN